MLHDSERILGLGALFGSETQHQIITVALDHGSDPVLAVSSGQLHDLAESQQSIGGMYTNSAFHA